MSATHPLVLQPPSKIAPRRRPRSPSRAIQPRGKRLAIDEPHRRKPVYQMPVPTGADVGGNRDDRVLNMANQSGNGEHDLPVLAGKPPLRLGPIDTVVEP